MRKLLIAAATAAALAPGMALATDGYFSHGYGIKAKGMGGTSAAVTQDAFGGANNPATMAFAGNQFALGVDLFSPWRKAERTGSANGLDGSAESDNNYFFVPELAFNYMLQPDLALGVTVYGNGGMNTDYPEGQITSAAGRGTCNQFQTGGVGPVQASYNLLCGNGKLGVDLSQLIVAPTAAWKFVPNHSVGLSPLFAYQRFKAEGLQAFGGFSTSANNMTNQDYDTSTGWGARVGYYGEITPQLAVGAAYATKMSMSKFDKYKGLFAEQGGFDIPSHYTLGVAFRPTRQWLVALDYERINYSDVKSVHNDSSKLLQCAGGNTSNCLGGSDGAGFGWQSIDVWKLALQYAIDEQWTVRAGYNLSGNPIRSQDVTINILAPGVVQSHYTLGTTWAWDRQNEISAAFMYAPTEKVSGSSLFNSFGVSGGQETIQMYQWSLGVQYANKF